MTPPSPPPALVRAGAVVGAVGAACVAYGTFIEREWYVVRRTSLPAVLSPGARPLRLLHVSDLHLDPPRPKRVAFVADLPRLRPDLVVATGDLLGAMASEDAAVAALAPLTADGTPGLVVLGSNDIFGPTPKSPSRYFLSPEDRLHGTRLDTDRLVAGLESTGWRVLRNETTTLDLDGTSVSVGAIDDPHLNDTIIPSAETLALADPHADLKLGLVHAPYRIALDRLEQTGHRLILSGHTHGGQVRFPPLGAVVANCDLPLHRVRGASRHGAAWLHVSAGLGTSKFTPFRFACRPEVSLLTLLPAGE